MLAGYAKIGTGYDFLLARFQENGAFDTSFNTTGYVVTDISGGGDDFGQSMAFQPDGKIVMAGSSQVGSNYVICLARFISGLNVGVHDLSVSTHDIMVYPNPAGKYTHLTYSLDNPENITIQLVDLSGRCLQSYAENTPQHAGKQEQEIILPGTLPPGAYWITIAASTGITAVKIVH
jgi:hypothetical protein